VAVSVQGTSGRSDFIDSPDGISRVTYPGLWKLGTYRTDNAGGLGQPNAASTRPFNIAKFSELYLVAAEAAVKGATTQAGKSAYDLVNVLRARAGKWRWDNNGNVAKVQDNSAAMIAATPQPLPVTVSAERRGIYKIAAVDPYDPNMRLLLDIRNLRTQLCRPYPVLVTHREPYHYSPHSIN
jgi:hypothetical protein